METQPKITIIIPVYNVADYLEECLNSVVRQTLSNIEIIVINDLSPDSKDDAICRMFSENDCRMKYLKHSINRRQGGARNTGLEVATGEYIWFIDSDDFLDINACEYLYAHMVKVKTDVLAFGGNDFINFPKSFRIREGYHYNQRNTELVGKTETGVEFMRLALEKRCFYVTCWSHLFEKSFVSRFRFREGVYREDTDLIPIIIRNAQSVHCISYAPYYRRIREGSDTQQGFTEKIMLDKFAYLKSLFDFIESQSLRVDDPLVRFTSEQFLYTSRMYSKFDYKSSKTEKDYETVADIMDKGVVSNCIRRMGAVKQINYNRRRYARKLIAHCREIPKWLARLK